MTVIEHLRALGLHEKQARSYVALLELGQATAYQVAQKSGLKRPITYVVLDELRKKGLVLKIPYAKKQLFVAKPPTELFAEFEEKLRFARRSLPELLSRMSESEARALYFEGEDGIAEALAYKEKETAGKEIFAFYGKGGGRLPKVYEEHNERLYAQKSKLRGFAPAHESLKGFRALDKKFGWNIVSLPENEFGPEVSVEITESLVRLVLYKGKQALVVDSPDFAKLMRQLFEMLWQNKGK